MLTRDEVKEGKANSIRDSTFSGWCLLTNYEYNRLSRIWVVWNDKVTLTLMFKSAQIITCSVTSHDDTMDFFCSFIYAFNFSSERLQLWEDIQAHHSSPIFQRKPWLLIGDYNEILRAEEHSGYLATLNSISSSTQDFQSVVSTCSLTDITSHGPQFTWWNKQGGNPISKKLDRALISDTWLQVFPHSYAQFESGGYSDHACCLVHLKSQMSDTRRPFKFFKILTTEEEFLPRVADYWVETITLFHSTLALYRFGKKLKGLKYILRNLNKEKVGELVKRANDAYEDLCNKQTTALLHPNSENFEAEIEASNRWQIIATLEEGFLKQKSKIHWIKEGKRIYGYPEGLNVFR